MSEGLDLLFDLVSIDSNTGSTEEAVSFLSAKARGWGMEAIVDRGSLIINPGAGELLLLGHIDTVAGDLPVRKDEGHLWGRGTVDAKGPLCAAISALRKVPELWSRVTLIAVPDEEGSSNTARRLRKELEKMPCVILEPSGWNGITIAYQGRVLLRVDVMTCSSHSGADAPFASEILIEKLISIIEGTGARVIDVQGGISEACATLDIRYTERPDLEKELTGMNYEILEDTPPIRSPKNTALVRSFLASIRENGGNPVFKRKTGTSDMNIIGEKWDVPMVAYGPGDSSLDHTDNEHISLKEFQSSVDVWKSFLSRYFSP